VCESACRGSQGKKMSSGKLGANIRYIAPFLDFYIEKSACGGTVQSFATTQISGAYRFGYLTVYEYVLVCPFVCLSANIL
jgi:hypothetical protein